MNLSKKYLKSVSTEELLKIADIYGLFIPNGLNRNFIIEELLELSEIEDVEEKIKTNFIISAQIGQDENSKLENADDEFISNIENPDVFENKKKNKNIEFAYNSTEIHILLRDPMWLFAFWDLSKIDYKKIIKSFGFDTFILRVLLFHTNNEYEPYDYYDILVAKEDRSRYFYLSFEDSLARVALCARSIDENITILAQSNFLHLNRRNIPKQLCTIDNVVNEVGNLSGLSILKKNHFKNYRQAFRNKEDNPNEE